MTAGRFDVWRHRASPALLHELAWPTSLPAVLVLEPTSTAIVLGSAVGPSGVAGSTTVRRRSGGGAVLVEPGGLIWIDVVIGRDDPRWDDDIVSSFHWLGDVWRDALVASGVDGVEVHHGPLVRTPLSDRVCFAGLGAGELTRNGAKIVGLSQRRTRAGARFQSACLLRWDPTPLIDALGLTPDDVEVLATAAAGVGDVAGLEAAFLATIATR